MCISIEIRIVIYDQYFYDKLSKMQIKQSFVNYLRSMDKISSVKSSIKHRLFMDNYFIYILFMYHYRVHRLLVNTYLFFALILFYLQVFYYIKSFFVNIFCDFYSTSYKLTILYYSYSYRINELLKLNTYTFV